MKSFFSRLFPWFVLGLSLVFAFVLWTLLIQTEYKKAAFDFNQRVDDVADNLTIKIQRDAYLLNSLRGLFTASDLVERNEFNSFIEALNLPKAYPGIYALAYAEHVVLQEKEAFIQSVINDTSINSQGYPNFSFKPDGQRENYVVLKYVFPEAGFVSVLGTDYMVDEARWAAMEKATAKNQVAITKEISSILDGDSVLMMALPVFSDGQTPGTDEPKGFVLAVLKSDSFFPQLFSDIPSSNDSFDLHIYDNTDGDHATLLFDYSPENNRLVNQGGLLEKEVIISVAGREWELHFFGPKDYNLTQQDFLIPWIVAASVVLLGLLLFIIFRVSFGARIKAVRLAETMTKNLRDSEAKFRSLFEDLTDAVFIHDLEGRFLMVNKVACQRLGYTETEFLNLSPQKIDAPEFAAQVPQRITKLREVGHATFESAHLKKSGEKIPVEINSSIINYQGQPAILSVVRDISERKKSEEQLRLRSQELEQLNKSMIGRELKMIELKEELARFKNQKNSEL